MLFACGCRSGSSFSRTARLIAAAAVQAGVTATSALAKENWIDVQTTNFHLVSNASEGETRKLALKLEQFRYAFTQLFSIQAVASEPVTVVVFKVLQTLVLILTK